MSSHNSSRVVFSDVFLALPEIKEIKDKYKSVGLHIALLLQLELGKHKNGIGKISRLRPISHEIGIQLQTLLNIMNDCSMFVMDYDHDIFFMPRLRKKLHLPVKLSAEEIKDVTDHGNVYIGYGERKEKASSSSDKDAGKITQSCEIFDAENADSHAETIYDSKGKSRMFKSKDEKRNDDAGEIKFKEILNNDSWRRSIRESRGVNLEDSNTFGIFVRWMYNYFCSNDKKMKNDTDLRQYAYNLLRVESLTRTDFDRFCEQQMADQILQSTDTENDNQPVADYEDMRHGIRYSCDGQVIPDKAPRQPSPQMAFSYIRNEWIPIDEYDRRTETKVFDDIIAVNKEYVRNYGGKLW